MQVAGGYLADRYPLKTVYLTTILVQVPAIWLAASLSGVPLVLIATFMVMSGAAQLPAENMLLARYTPARRHGLRLSVVEREDSTGCTPLSLASRCWLSPPPPSCQVPIDAPYHWPVSPSGSHVLTCK